MDLRVIYTSETANWAILHKGVGAWIIHLFKTVMQDMLHLDITPTGYMLVHI